MIFSAQIFSASLDSAVGRVGSVSRLAFGSLQVQFKCPSPFITGSCQLISCQLLMKGTTLRTG